MGNVQKIASSTCSRYRHYRNIAVVWQLTGLSRLCSTNAVSPEGDSVASYVNADVVTRRRLRAAHELRANEQRHFRQLLVTLRTSRHRVVQTACVARKRRDRTSSLWSLVAEAHAFLPVKQHLLTAHVLVSTALYGRLLPVHAADVCVCLTGRCVVTSLHSLVIISQHLSVAATTRSRQAPWARVILPSTLVPPSSASLPCLQRPLSATASLAGNGAAVRHYAANARQTTLGQHPLVHKRAAGCCKRCRRTCRLRAKTGCMLRNAAPSAGSG